VPGLSWSDWFATWRTAKWEYTPRSLESLFPTTPVHSGLIIANGRPWKTGVRLYAVPLLEPPVSAEISEAGAALVDEGRWDFGSSSWG